MEAAVARLRRCRNESSLALVYLAAGILLAAAAASTASALSDAEASDIARRQLLSLREGDGDLPDDFEFDIHVDVTLANERLRRAYVALQAWRRAIYSDPKNFTGGWVGADVCSYFGVTWAPALDHGRTTVVAGVDLNGGDIAGYLPAELGMLTDIAFVHINSNRFCGIIPKSFSRLALLHELDVSNNRLVGGFPDVELQIPVLKYLDFRFNDFDGALPPHLFDKDLLFQSPCASEIQDKDCTPQICLLIQISLLCLPSVASLKHQYKRTILHELLNKDAVNYCSTENYRKN